MYFCKNCGRLAHPGEDRCPKCGAAHIQPALAAAAPTGPAAPQYHPAEDAPEQDVPALGFSSTLGTLVIFTIPLVGFIMMLVWSFFRRPGQCPQAPGPCLSNPHAHHRGYLCAAVFDRRAEPCGRFPQPVLCPALREAV